MKLKQTGLIIGGCFLGLVAIGLALPEPETPPAPVTTEKPEPPKPEKEPDVTAEELQAFIAAVRYVDPGGELITDIQQFEDSGLLALTVSPAFSSTDKVAQGDAVIGLRDLWLSKCDCVGILNFETAAGQQLITIGASGQPDFAH